MELHVVINLFIVLICVILVVIGTVSGQTPPVSGQTPTMCVECTNYVGDTFYDFCPMNGTANLGRVATNNDCMDKCFTRTDAQNPDRVVRGCTTGFYLPSPLPPDGCYEWNSETWCICRKTLCNFVALGASSGVRALNTLVGGPGNGNEVVEVDGVKKCYDCVNYSNGNYYEQCPRNATVWSTAGLSPCTGTCFTRSYIDDEKLVGRGCSVDSWGLPDPLPEAGCYDKSGETWCFCDGSRCNAGPMGQSSGVDIREHVKNVDKDVTEDDGTRHCHQCTNYDADDKYYPQCAKYSWVTTAYHQTCNGSCFTRSFHDNDKKVARGCTNKDESPTLPRPLPPEEGCYDYNSEVWCICNTSRCNGAPLGNSSGVDLSEHLADIVIEKEDDGTRHCYQCINYDDADKYHPQCVKHSRVTTAYRQTCNGSCFTRSFRDNDKKVARGCTDNNTLPSFPRPLPPEEGCYDYNSEVWCICNTSRCNGAAMGKSSGVDLTEHFANIVIDKEDDGTRHCYQCSNYDADKNYYPQCAKHSWVTTAYHETCSNGSCYTRSTDYDDRLVERGCTGNLPRLDYIKPLPPDGCYTYFSAVWCICSTSSRCNGSPIGEAQQIELDAHIQKGSGVKALMCDRTWDLVAATVFLLITAQRM